MKIAVTYEDGQIFQHFGHTAQFKIYDGVDMEELKAKRDKQLFEVFRLEKQFLDDPV